MKTEIVKAYCYCKYEGYTTTKKVGKTPDETAYFMKITDGKEIVWCKIGNNINENWCVNN